VRVSATTSLEGSQERTIVFLRYIDECSENECQCVCSSTHDGVVSDVDRSLVVAMKGDGIGNGEANFSEE